MSQPNMIIENDRRKAPQAGIKPAVPSAFTGAFTGAIAVVGAIALLFLSQSAAVARGAPDSFADMAEELLPTVVNISTEQVVDGTERRRMPPGLQLPPDSPFRDFFDEFFDQQQEEDENADNDEDDDGPLPSRPAALGSGYVIDPDGYIVTNNHVIGEADKVFVRFSDGKRLEAEIVGRDALLDVALLKVEADHPLPAIRWGNSDEVRVGEWVMAIGNPFGLGGSVTAGIVSALERSIGAGNYDYFIQTDASINRGNSGGPLFNMDGDVIGMNTMIFSPTGGNIGIGFAIPSNQSRQIINQLREHGHARRGWIGVSIQNVTDEVAESLGLDEASGAIVGSIVPDGPAEKAGILAGDIILSFDGESIEDVNELPRVVAGTPIDKTVKVKLLRQGSAVVVSLTTGELNPEGEVMASAEEPGSESDVMTTDRVLGMRLSSLNAVAREQLELPDDIEGVMIAGMSRRSEAAFRGIRRGDIIVQVNQTDVDEAAEIAGIVDDAKEAGRKAVLLRIYRDGAFLHIPLPLPENEKG